MKKLLLLFTLSLQVCLSFAQLITPFTVRYAITQKGGIVMIGNTAAGCGAGTTCTGGTCTTAHSEIPPAGVGVDNDFIQSYVDIDGNASTFMSSSDSLNLPSCSLISFAGLYWSAGGAIGSPDGLNWATRADVKLKVNNGAYQNLSADVIQDNNIGYKSYHCFKDITSIVAAAGAKGRYTVADMPLLNDNGVTMNRWGGWAIVIVYKNELQALRNLTVFNGLTNVSSVNTITDIPISGFLTPPVGPIDFELGLITFDGDRGAAASGLCASTYKGDSLLFKGVSAFKSISDPIHPANDVFNSTISANGVLTPFRNPNYKNTLGFDANIFFPNNGAKAYIGNSATSAVIRQKTGGETYLTQVVTSAIDVFEPDLRGGLDVVDINGGTLQSGDTLEYTALIKNIGSNPSKNTYILDTFALHSNYVPGSIRIVYGPNSGNKTDVAGDDQAEYFPAARSIRVRIGTGANAVTGGQLTQSPTGIDSTVVKFRVTATDDCMLILCNNVIDNRFRVIGTGFISNNTFDNGSNPAIFDSNGCPIQGSTSSTISPITCTPPVALNNSPVCIGGDINLSVQPGSAFATYSWTGPGGFTSTVQNPVITNATPSMAGAYTVTVAVAVGGTNCVFTATSTAVSVSSTPTMTSASSATVCSGDNLNFPLTGNNTTGFTWQAIDNPNVSGENTSLQSTSTIINTLINNTNIAQVVSYSVTPIGGCAGVTQTVNVTVNPGPTVTSSATDTICSGTNINFPLSSSIPSTFSWIAVNNANTSGESISSQMGSTINNTIINSTSVPQTVNYTITPTSTSGGCVSLSPQTFSVIVNPAPIVTNASSATICSGTNASINLTSSIPATFVWSAADNGSTTGESITLQSTMIVNDVIINNTSSPQTVNYTIAPTSIAGGCITLSPQTLSVLVNPAPIITGSNSLTICSGSVLNQVLNSSIPSSFSWMASDNTNIIGESLSSQNTSVINDSLINTSLVSQTVIYSVTPTSTAGGCASLLPQLVTVNVDPAPTMTSSSNATICSGNSVAIILTSGIPSSFTWQALDNINTTGEGLSSQNGNSINDTIINNTTVQQTVSYIVTPTSTAGGCTALTPQTVAVLVNPAPVINGNTSATICSGSSAGIILSSSIPCTFSWVASDNLNTNGESLIPQSCSDLNDTILNNSTLQETINYIVTPTSTNGGCASLSPQAVTVYVNPAPVITGTASSTICSGSNAGITLTTSVACTFSWIATDNASTTGESTVIQNSNVLNDTIINNSSVQQTVNYSVSPTSASGGCASLVPQSVTVIVNPSPVITNASATTICSGTNLNLFLTSSIPSTYEWVAADNTNTIGESLTPQFTSTVSDVITNPGSSPQTVIYTVILTDSSTSCTSQAPQTVSVLVNPSDDASFSYGSSTFCQSGNNPVLILSGLPGGSFSSSSPLLNLNSSDGSINLASSALGTYSVTYLTNGVCPNSMSTNITVTDAPSSAFTFSNLSYCQNSLPNPLPIFSSGSSGGVFSSTAGLVIDSISGQVNLSASMPGTYLVTNFIAASGSCAVSTSTYTVTIIPPDNAAFNYSSPSFCQGAGSPSALISGVSGGVFSSSPSGLALDPATGQIDLASSAPSTYNVNYQTTGTCPNSSSVSVVVYALPAASTSSSVHSIDCGDSLTLDGTGSTMGANYVWSTANGNIVSGNTSLNPSINQPGTYILLVTDVNGCSSSSTVNVNASLNVPVASFTTTPSPATGTVPLVINLTNTSVNANTYNWTFGTGPGSSAVDPLFTYTEEGTYEIQLIASNNGLCSDTSSVIVVVNPEDIFFIPEGFSPNGDGTNDLFVIKGIEKYSNNNFVIFNRWGNIVYQAKPYKNQWDGTATEGFRVGGNELPVSSYFFLLDLGDGSKPIKGSIYLNR